MKPSEAFNLKRDEIRKTILRYSVINPRVFGSVLHKTDSENSDLDLLVDALPGTTLLDLCRLQEELEDLLGVRVHLLTPGEISVRFHDKVLAEALPV